MQAFLNHTDALIQTDGLARTFLMPHQFTLDQVDLVAIFLRRCIAMLAKCVN